MRQFKDPFKDLFCGPGSNVTLKEALQYPFLKHQYSLFPLDIKSIQTS